MYGQGYPQGHPQGYPPPPPPPPPRSSGPSALTIVLIVIIVALVLGGGGCLLCVGLAAVANDESTKSGASDAAGTAPAQPGLVHDELAQQLEGRFRQQGVPATSVMCPAEHAEAFSCELTVGTDRADVEVKQSPAGLAFDVPGVAFLDGAKLTTTFRTSIASKIDPKLTVPCFTGTLMKKVGAAFVCEVTSGGKAVGQVTTTVDDAKGNVRMDYAGSKAGAAPAPKAGPRVVEYACPGKVAGVAVRAGCLCGDEIVGTACGAPGNFTDVTATPTGCRFVCGN